MSDWLLSAGLSAWKPLLTAVLLPPTPFLLLLLGLLLPGLAATRSRPGRRRRAATGLVIGCIWFTGCSGGAEMLKRQLLWLPPPLTAERLVELRAIGAKERVAIIVLGGGVEDWAPEYQGSSLAFRSLERLRYGVWLSGQTHWPLGFSGGTGWGRAPSDAVAEASVAQEIATQEFHRPMRWVEARSRDTHENAVNTVALLKGDGVSKVLLVTHQWHMARAVRNFAAASKGSIEIIAAPLGLAVRQELPLLRWVPSGDGLTLSRQVIREKLGLLLGA